MVEREVQHIRELLKLQQLPAALRATETLLVTVPENRDVLYLRAVAQRLSGDIPGALDTIAGLERLYPRFSGLHQERGHCHVALRQAPAAIQAFLRAVNINPALPASWGLLERLYRMAGQTEEAARAAEHLATLGQLPSEIVTATALFSDGELAPAEQLIRAYLRTHSDHVEAMRLLARIGVERDVLDDAQLLLEKVLEIAPDYHVARFEYAQVLARRHLYLEARSQAQRLLALEPGDRNYRTLHALTLVGLGQHEQALALYRELLAGAAQPAELHLSIAHSLKTLGATEAAIAEYRLATIARPGYGEAYWSLANLKTYRFTDEEIGQMRAAEAAPATATVDRYHLCFALGKALEDQQKFAPSFEFYSRGNALKRSSSGYDPQKLEAGARLQREVCTRALFARHAGSGSPAPDPIFIVGLPRSGSTLLEQILASHSAIEGTQELADLPRMVNGLQGREAPAGPPLYPRILARMTAEDCRRLGEQYLRDTRAYRATGRPRFIDKMPNNFRHIGLIHLILPNARIIDARREPMACCFSNFKQLFAQGQTFTYGLEDIARYYRTYLELMRHWDEVLPGRVLRVHYEDMVDDLEESVRRLLDHCGLELEPACLAFHQTARSVRTPSSEQVRRPIYREGLEQWRHYEPWLGPLREALGDAVDRYREQLSL
ncbi:MAG: sulfotransferase [Gammaproteobacteria bacterium]|nr:sulfotransferase [Gammaproteobacteria bacterium]MDE2262916.1 sulfotransferase [Gammaproteobacteria bacterium]